MADPLDKLRSPYGTATISRLMNGRFHGCFASEHISTAIEGCDEKTLMDLGYMYRYTRMVDAMLEARQTALKLIGDEAMVSQILKKVDLVDLGRIGPVKIPEPLEMKRFLDLFPKTMVENKRLERENYQLSNQLSFLQTELENMNVKVEQQVKKRVAVETQELNKKVESAEEEAALMFLELEEVRKLHKVDLKNKNTFDLLTGLKAAYKRIDNLKDEIKKLHFEFMEYKAFVSIRKK